MDSHRWKCLTSVQCSASSIRYLPLYQSEAEHYNIKTLMAIKHLHIINMSLSGLEFYLGTVIYVFVMSMTLRQDDKLVGSQRRTNLR